MCACVYACAHEHTHLRKSLFYHCNRFFTKNLVNLALEGFIVVASFVFLGVGSFFVVLKGRYEQIVIINNTKRNTNAVD